MSDAENQCPHKTMIFLTRGTTIDNKTFNFSKCLECSKYEYKEYQ